MSTSEDFLKFLKVYQSGEYLIKEGAEDKDFFCLIQGKVGIWKGDPADKDSLVKVGSFDTKATYFGEMGYLLNETRTASIIAEDTAKVLKFPGEMLPELIMKQPSLGLKVSTALADRLKGTTSQTEAVAQQRNELRDDSTLQLHDAKETFQKMFMLLTAIQSQFQNPLLKASIEWMSRSKLLQGGRKPHVDEVFLRDIPPRLADLLQRSYGATQ